MKRSPLAVAATLVLAAALSPASASASILELGATKSPVVPPTCPPGFTGANCTIVLTQTTAFETARDGAYYPSKVTAAGRIVAFTIGLARLSSNVNTAKKDIAGLDAAYGGDPQVAITVLKPGPRRLWTVTAESPIYHVQPFLGYVVQYPLDASLAVAPGDTVALTVVTWAPVLSINLAAKPNQYRASRVNGCTTDVTNAVQTAQLKVGARTRYFCRYTATRVEYSATEVTTPPVPSNAIK